MVILIILNILSCQAAAAQSSSARVLNIERNASASPTMTLEITDPSSGTTRNIQIITDHIPSDIQLNSRIQLDIAAQQSDAANAHDNATQLYRGTALRLDMSGINGSDKTGVRARMKQASSGGFGSQRGSHRGRH
ncbi:MAG: hypothetical protein RBR22_08950 [Desulfuromonas sp.]|nr:hypothetical protein [Desulfuromonas sp.]